MKKIAVLLILSCFSININSAMSNETLRQSDKSSIELIQKVAALKQVLLFEYESLNDLELHSPMALTEFISSSEEDCMVTATVTLSHTGHMEGNVGVANTGQATTITISASVTASCDQIKGAVKRLIADLKATLGI